MAAPVRVQQSLSLLQLFLGVHATVTATAVTVAGNCSNKAVSRESAYMRAT
jgi:hypothetical protein